MSSSSDDEYQNQAPPQLNFGNPFAQPLPGAYGGGAGVPPARSAQQPQYLEYNTKGRPWMERLFYNTGVSTLIGTFAGGAYGAIEGWGKSPRPKFKVKVNSMLNHAGRRGSKAGNALGSVAMLYTFSEGITEMVELEHMIPSSMPGNEYVVPMISAVATGLVYKSTKGPRVMAVYAAAGALGIVGLEVGSQFAQNGVLPSF